MNLEQLRKQAKERVRSARAEGRELKLATAQLELAREHGYPSWPALVHALEASPEAFVRAAVGQRRARAEALLAARPELAEDPWVALTLGRAWEGDANKPGGPLGWAPLLYVCHSCFASAALAQELTARGADPNGFFVNEYGRMSALYGAAGVVHDPALTRVLLEAGADPNDGESVYHATESEDTECLRLLLEHDANPRGTNGLAHALDDERLEHVRLLLDHGADPHEGALVAHAVRRGRGPDTLRLLAEYGADVDRPGGETWRGNVPLRTPYQHAVLRGREDITATLAELGAGTDVSDDDRAIGAVARGERPSTPLPRELDVDAQEVLILAALRGHAALVADLVGADFAGVVGGSPHGTLLHHAAWVGDPEVVHELLALGADPNAPSDATYSTPLAWAAHGSHGGTSGHIEVAEALVAAGAEIEPRLLEVADGPLYDWLAERLV
jgi:ankyrin repeat protein